MAKRKKVVYFEVVDPADIFAEGDSVDDLLPLPFSALPSSAVEKIPSQFLYNIRAVNKEGRLRTLTYVYARVSTIDDMEDYDESVLFELGGNNFWLDTCYGI